MIQIQLMRSECGPSNLVVHDLMEFSTLQKIYNFIVPLKIQGLAYYDYSLSCLITPYPQWGEILSENVFLLSCNNCIFKNKNSLSLFNIIECMGIFIVIVLKLGKDYQNFKGQIISKGLLVSSNSPKKRIFTTTMNSFIHFLGEFKDTKKFFRNYLAFSSP